MFLVLIIHSISLKETFAEKPQFARNRHILQETEQDLPGAPQSPLHIPSSLAHSRCNAVRHVSCLHNARSITTGWGRGRKYTNFLYLRWLHPEKRKQLQI